MKKISLLLLSLFIYTFAQSQEVYMYDENGEKIYFQTIDSVKFVQIKDIKNN